MLREHVHIYTQLENSVLGFIHTSWYLGHNVHFPTSSTTISVLCPTQVQSMASFRTFIASVWLTSASYSGRDKGKINQSKSIFPSWVEGFFKFTMRCTSTLKGDVECEHVIWREHAGHGLSDSIIELYWIFHFTTWAKSLYSSKYECCWLWIAGKTYLSSMDLNKFFSGGIPDLLNFKGFLEWLEVHSPGLCTPLHAMVQLLHVKVLVTATCVQEMQ